MSIIKSLFLDRKYASRPIMSNNFEKILKHIITFMKLEKFKMIQKLAYEF